MILFSVFSVALNYSDENMGDLISIIISSEIFTLDFFIKV